MRSTYYYRSRRPNSKKDIYQLKKISSATDRPILKPVIINDWLADQAYIFIEKNDYPHFHPDTLQVYWLDADTTGMFFMTTPTKEAQYEFAGEVYEALMTGKSLKLKTDKGELMPFLNEEKDALHFVTILRDYYRLTEVR